MIGVEVNPISQTITAAIRPALINLFRFAPDSNVTEIFKTWFHFFNFHNRSPQA